MSDTTTVINLKITGMTCGGCVKTVTNALQGVKGVVEATVDLDTGSAEVKADTSADTNEMVLAVKLAGYGAEVVV